MRLLVGGKIGELKSGHRKGGADDLASGDQLMRAT
jgi:hypothetical protein